MENVMTINIFEGARRISKLIAILWVVGFAGYLIYFPFSDPYIGITYMIKGPNSLPVRSTQSCGYSDNASQYLDVVTQKGTKAHVTLCFLAWTSNTGAKLIPYRIDSKSGQWWGATKYSSEITEYTASVLKRFTFEEPEDWSEFPEVTEQATDEDPKDWVDTPNPSNSSKVTHDPHELPPGFTLDKPIPDQHELPLGALTEQQDRMAQLEAALIKAHNAGNTEHAKAFADEIRRLRGVQADNADPHELPPGAVLLPDGDNTKLPEVSNSAKMRELTKDDSKPIQANKPTPQHKPKNTTDISERPWENDPDVEFSNGVSKQNFSGVAARERKTQRSPSRLLTQTDEEWIDNEWWRKLTEQAKLSITFIAGGIVSLWSLTWVVGWIVRGFLGIPMGRDFRTKS
jgi:hypothetical protein